MNPTNFSKYPIGTEVVLEITYSEEPPTYYLVKLIEDHRLKRVGSCPKVVLPNTTKNITMTQQFTKQGRAEHDEGSYQLYLPTPELLTQVKATAVLALLEPVNKSEGMWVEQDFIWSDSEVTSTPRRYAVFMEQGDES